MQHIATDRAQTRTSHEPSADRSPTRFTQRFAVGAAVFYTLLFVAAGVAAPELLSYAMAWFLWFTVMAAAGVTYAAGRHISRQSTHIG